MSEQPTKRRYHSPRRQAQAEATRQRLLDVARALFASQGYAATTLPTIAREAGVSVPTVTAVFGSKRAILDTLIAITVRGDETPTLLIDREWWQKMLAEPDPTRQVRQWAAGVGGIHERSTDIFEIVRGAATADPELATLRRDLAAGRLRDSRTVTESLASKGALAPGLAVERATDLLWALGSAEMYRLLVAERGWSPGDYEQWLADALIDALFDNDVPR